MGWPESQGVDKSQDRVIFKAGAAPPREVMPERDPSQLELWPVHRAVETKGRTRNGSAPPLFKRKLRALRRGGLYPRAWED